MVGTVGIKGVFNCRILQRTHGSFISPVTGVRMLLLALPLIGYGATLISDATLADVLLAGMVLAAFGAWRRWERFRGEKPEWY